MRSLFLPLLAGAVLVGSAAHAQTAPQLGHWMVAISVADLDA